MSRRYPEHPLLGVGAIIFQPLDQSEDLGAATVMERTTVLSSPSETNPAPRILIVERAGNPLKGYWSLPGGLVETGETLETAVKREILEETGLQVEPQQMFELFERIMRDDLGQAEYHYVLVDYLCTVVGGTLQAGDDVSRAEWVRREDLPALLITEGTLDVIERAYRARRSCT